MPKTLMILAHPRIEESIGNKIISDLTNTDKNVEVRHLNFLYPDFKIDIKAEQKALESAENIIFQYPLYWYSTPAILKEWIDQVFEYGFAFGTGSKLTNKNIIVSITIGSGKKDYPQEVLDKILFPFQGLAAYCKMNYIGEVLSNNINNYNPEAAEEAKITAKEHAEKLLNLINK